MNTQDNDHRHRQGHHPQTQTQFQDSLAFLDDVMPLEIDQPRAGPSGSVRKEASHPLLQLEDDLGIWCARQGMYPLQSTPLGGGRMLTE